MQRLITASLVVLILQVGLIVLLTAQENRYEPYVPNIAVVEFEKAQIDTITLSGEDNKTIELAKNGDTWLITGDPSIPAASEIVDGFLTQLADAKRGLAVATTKDAAERFKVSENNYISKLILQQKGESIGEIYFGSSAGYKQLHTRTAGSDEVITVPLGSHEVSTDMSQWIDKDIFQVDKEKIEKITFRKIELRIDGAKWKGISDDAEKEDLPAGKDLAEKIASLSVTGKSTAGLDEQVSEVTLNTVDTEGNTLTWDFYKEGESGYAVKRSDLPYRLIVSSWQIDEIKKVQDEISAAFLDEDPQTVESLTEESIQPQEMGNKTIQ